MGTRGAIHFRWTSVRPSSPRSKPARPARRCAKRTAPVALEQRDPQRHVVQYVHMDAYPSSTGVRLLLEMVELMGQMGVDGIVAKLDRLKVVDESSTEPTAAEIAALRAFMEPHAQIGDKMYYNADEGMSWNCLLEQCQGSLKRTLASGYVYHTADYDRWMQWSYVLDFTAGTLSVYDGDAVGEPCAVVPMEIEALRNVYPAMKDNLGKMDDDDDDDDNDELNEETVRKPRTLVPVPDLAEMGRLLVEIEHEYTRFVNMCHIRYPGRSYDNVVDDGTAVSDAPPITDV